ncbi:hypothetical protein Tco_0109141 [Tanacetum coccineum]
MVACLWKSEGNADFHEIVDFLTTSTIHYALISGVGYRYCASLDAAQASGNGICLMILFLKKLVQVTDPGVTGAEGHIPPKTVEQKLARKNELKAKSTLMLESEPEQTKTKLQQRQERAGYEATVRLQEHLDKEDRQRISRMHEEASSFYIEEWENIQATIEADEELAQRIQVEEREKYSEAKKQDCLQNLSTRERDIFPNKELKKGGTSHSCRLNRELICLTISSI